MRINANLHGNTERRIVRRLHKFSKNDLVEFAAMHVKKEKYFWWMSLSLFIYGWGKSLDRSTGVKPQLRPKRLLNPSPKLLETIRP